MIRSSRLILVGVALAFLLPFVNRPVYIDDHAHFAQARELSSHFLEPYDSTAGELGWAKGETPTEANPPLYFYLVGAWTKCVGGEVWKSHLLLLPLHLLALLGFYSLARRYVRHALWAALLWLVSPHFWLTANSLLLDALLAPAIVGGVACWVKGWEEDRRAWLVVGALSLGLAPLVKYTGLVSWGVVVVWMFVQARREKMGRLAFLAVPILLFAAWLFWSRTIYGQTHFDAVAKASMEWPSIWKLIPLMVFSAGTTTCLLLSLFTLSRRHLVHAAVILGLSLAIGIGIYMKRSVGIQIGFWMGIFLLWCSLAVFQPRTSGWKFLSLWALGGLGTLFVARGWFCARYFVVAGPPLVLLTVMGLEARRPSWVDRRLFRLTVFIVLAAFSGALALADLEQATVDVSAASRLESIRAPGGDSLRGHYPSSLLSGLGYYLDGEHWYPLAPREPVPEKSWVVLPRRSLSPAFFPAIGPYVPVAELPYKTWNPFRTHDMKVGAGFYGSIWGPLPFSFSSDPMETYVVLAIPPSATVPSKDR
ncbi:MAG TPA: glycosyltransferase family 39 protein [Elusimicrobiota bacterium]|nr:glycosyltransferase family 39 protein [Elusimicrobiota bacterium]